jgi:dihydroxyacetone kinase DhaKLM complex PTS-EIIA-like component DhaM
MPTLVAVEAAELIVCAEAWAAGLYVAGAPHVEGAMAAADPQAAEAEAEEQIAAEDAAAVSTEAN